MMKWALRFPYLNDGNNISVLTVADSKGVIMNIIRETIGLTGQDIEGMKVIITDK
jgi:hypothetical protein